MKDYVMNYLFSNGVSINSVKEEQEIEEGISLFLTECGLDQSKDSEYARGYVRQILSIIDPRDIKQIFLRYNVISRTRQLAAEGRTYADPEMMKCLTELNECGLYGRYTPFCDDN